MALVEYVRKRNFQSTPEPKGRQHKKTKRDHLMFVIHEHHASHLHYDFRLEWDGTLKSWAVPKGPSLDPHTKRLAVEVEDHPIEYGKFEGVIPEKQYGAGQVYIWDTGTWSPEGDASAALKKGRLEFELKGSKLKGRWMLLRTKGRSSSKPQWLLIKRTDDFVQAGHEAQPDGEIKAQKKSKTAKAKTSTKKTQPKAADRLSSDFQSPALALLVSEPPKGRDWVHETKFDGYRIQAVIRDSKVQLFTRAGNDWTDRFPEIAKYLNSRKIKEAVLDGEVVWLDQNNRSDFQKMQNAIKSPDHSQLYYYVFDMMKLNDKDITDLPLAKRKKLLEALLQDHSIKGPIRYSEHSKKSGDELLKSACSLKLEGLVSKRIDSPYPKGRSGEWVKSKCVQQQEFVIGGFTNGTGSRVGFGALLLGVYEGKKLRYVGKVGTGFSNASLKELKKKLSDLVQDQNPFESSADLPRQQVFWVTPRLSAEITFAEWTADGQLRVPVFHGLREDKPAQDIHEEVPVKISNARSSNKKAKASKKSAKSDVPATEDVPAEMGGIRITHPDKVLFTDEKITKLDVAEYYHVAASWMLPFIEGRPLTLVRCPEGAQKSCFIQKHVMSSTPKGIETIEIQEKNKTSKAMLATSEKSLMSLVQMGTLEMHCWNSTQEDLEKPNQIVMDFDPGAGVEWKDLQKAAFTLKKILDSMKLKSFIKLSGGKGLHVHIPFQPLYSWDDVKDFAKMLALKLEEQAPDLYVSKMAKSLRDEKIFVDYLRNSRGATAVAPYSLRSKETSSVAMPLDWEELKKIKGPKAFSLPEAIQYLQKRKADPWKDYFKKLQKLPLES